MNSLYTIGHSNHAIAAFIALLQKHGVTALYDVRTHPYSRHVPQYSQDALKSSLIPCNIAYVFLGKELGARSRDPDCYVQGKVQYTRLATKPTFLAGIEQVIQGLSQYKIALMCAEKDPLDCHRAILVARKLAEMSIVINHIHLDGSLETHYAMESRLLALHHLPEGDMFNCRTELVANAYLLQGKRIAYQDVAMMKSGPRTAN